MLFDMFPFLLAPDEGGGSEGGAPAPTSTGADTGNPDGDGKPADANADGDPAQPGKGETVSRAEYEKALRDGKRATKALEERTKADEEAKRKADEEQGNYRELYESEKAERVKLAETHQSALRLADAKAELNKHTPRDTKIALLALQNAEGFAEAEDLAAFTEAFVEANGFLFGTEEDDGGGANHKTTGKPGRMKGGPAVDYLGMDSKTFEAEVARRKGSF